MDIRSSLTRQRLIRAAEILMARQGVAAVTTRDILNLAGQRNQSALHYHFGSKEGLIRSALTDQMERIDGRRLNLLTKAGDGPAGILRAALLPMAEDLLASERSHDQLSLLLQFLHTPPKHHSDECHYDRLLQQTRFPGICGVRNMIWDTMPPMHHQLRMMRYGTAFSAAFTALLVWSEAGTKADPDEFAEELTGTIHPILYDRPDSANSFCWPRETDPHGKPQA